MVKKKLVIEIMQPFPVKITDNGKDRNKRALNMRCQQPLSSMQISDKTEYYLESWHYWL